MVGTPPPAPPPKPTNAANNEDKKDEKKKDKSPAISPSKTRPSQSPSPSRRRGRTVVQRVVKEVGGAGTFPILSKTNYADWSLVMKVKLEARGLWEVVEFGSDDRQEDRMALEAILLGLPLDMQGPISTQESATEAWEAIRKMRIGSDRVRKSSAQSLRRKYEAISFNDGEDLEDFAMRLSAMVSQLQILGDPEPPAKVAEKYLRIVPAKYTQIALSIETLLDVSKMSIEEITGRLRAVDDRQAELAGSTPSSDGKLLLTEEQWLARQKERNASERSSKPKQGKRRPRRPKKKNTTDARDAPAKDKCLNCGRTGHWAKDCRSPKRQQANLAKEDDDDNEPSLFLAEICALSLHPDSTPLHLDESRAQALLGSTDDTERLEGWYLDTGASNHMSGRLDVFSDLDRSVVGDVKFGDGSVVEIQGRGSIVFSGRNGEHKVLTGVYFIPRLKNSIISVGQLDEGGSKVEIEDGVMRIWDQQRRLMVKVERGRSRLYILHLTVAKPVCLTARAGAEDAWLWHDRYGHLSFDALRRLARDDMVRHLPKLEHVEQLCETCITTKHRRASFPAKAKFRADTPLELVHGDLCGPVTPATPGGRRYILLLVDDYSRFMWLELLSAKSDAEAAIKKVRAAAENQSGCRLRVLRTDNGGEFTSAEFTRYCEEEGVERHFSAPYTPQQNGVVERRNQTVLATARALLKQRKMPARYWGEAVSTAVFLLNRAPTKSLDGKTPYEAWTGKKPSVSFLRTFGCLAYAKIVKPSASKLEDRSRPLVFIGYASGTKAYRLLDPATGKVTVSRDVIFDEAVGWDWSGQHKEAETAATPYDFRVERAVRQEILPAPAGNEGARTPSPPPATMRSPSLAPAPAPDASEPATPPPAAVVDVPTLPVFVTPLADDEERLDAWHGETPVRYRTINNVLGDAIPPGRAARDLNGELHLACTGEPSTFAEANKDAAWRAAMEEEMQSVEENSTWKLVDLPHGHRPIGLKWVFKLKQNEAGNIIKHKARLVAKGYVQQPGVDYEDAFAPVARLESVRLLLAMAGHNGWAVHHMDVKSAFLNGVLREEVYVSQPPGFAVAGEENKVLRLHKALYGLRQAPRAWNARLDGTLKSLGFKQSPHEAGIYARGGDSARTLVGVYVDDLIITGASDKEVQRFKAEMKAQFKMSDLGLLSFYLGIEVQQNADGITVSQGSYAKKVLEVAGMANCNHAHTPMEERLKLSRMSEAAEVDATFYRRIVGCLRYLCHTRPDIAFSVGYVSRFLQRPTEEHMVAVKRILRYIAGTLHYGCFYARSTSTPRLHGYSDSDLAGDIDTSKSTSGGIFFLEGGPVSWHSLKQRVVALSSCEAEYVAAASAATQAVWLARLLSDFTGDPAETVGLKLDNMSAMALIKNPVFHDKSKHIRIKYHYVREASEDGSISTSFIGTKDQLADILTKALGRVRFQELRARIGMVQVNQVHKD
ncbi:unnamed protein product [Urochloa humidicola]